MTQTTSQPVSGWLSGRPAHISSMRCCPSEVDPPLADAIATGREAVRVASLASTDQMVTATRPLTCPNATDKVVMELYSGEVYPDRCRVNSCLYCVSLNARRRALAITIVAPERMITLTLAAERHDNNPCKTALIRIKRIRERLKETGRDPGEWCYTLEKNPKGTGYHVHCLQAGGYIPQRELQNASHRARAGIADIRYIHRKGIWTSRYGLKGFGADGYGLKTFRPNGSPAEALRINNDWLEHHTTGFYQFDGEVLPVREAERLAIAQMNADSPKAFVAMTGKYVQRVLGDGSLRHRLIMDVNARSAAKLRAFH
jgi:hypothetical protein